MEYLVTAAEMKQYDVNTIEELGIPGMVLMERAALETFRVIETQFGKNPVSQKRVFILAGMGNNGGDGLALARLLCEAGYAVTVLCVGKTVAASESWKQQKRILEHFPVIFCENIPEVNIEYTIMIDALFGVGLSREVTGEYAEAITAFNRTSGYKIALDIPSGVDADTGRVLGCAIRADMTVTYGFMKRGLLFYPGAEYAGEVVRAEIGISERSFLGKTPEMFYYKEEASELLPKRRADGNKGTFGKVLLVAGSSKMAGAAVLAAGAAYRVGAGMVKVISSPDNRDILQTTVPEALFGTEEDLENSLRWADMIAVGPGIGTGEEAVRKLKKVLMQSTLPLVLDADALNLLAQDIQLQECLSEQGNAGRKMILTPHVGELSRLMQLPIPKLKEDLSGYARKLAGQLAGVIVAKDARTFICQRNGPVCVNVTGNCGMATAGTGDVLTGMISGLLAQGMDPFQAASVGAYLHGRAGETATACLGEHGCMAGDLIRYAVFQKQEIR